MSATLLPVGVDLGAIHDATSAGPATHRVLVGSAVHELGPAEYATWTRAHRTGRSGAPAETDGLVAAGLLAEVDDPAGFLARYRLMPRFVGLGTSTEHRYDLGVPGLPPVATIDRAAFEVWEWAAVAPTLSVHCEVLTAVDGTPGAEPASFAPAVLAAVRDLLEAAVAFLVPAGGSGAPS
jgi:hypothetical protein